MLSAESLVEEHIGWIVRDRLMQFWHDNWMGSCALYYKVEVFHHHSVATLCLRGDGMSRCCNIFWSRLKFTKF